MLFASLMSNPCRDISLELKYSLEDNKQLRIDTMYYVYELAKKDGYLPGLSPDEVITHPNALYYNKRVFETVYRSLLSLRFMKKSRPDFNDDKYQLENNLLYILEEYARRNGIILPTP